MIHLTQETEIFSVKNSTFFLVLLHRNIFRLNQALVDKPRNCDHLKGDLDALKWKFREFIQEQERKEQAAARPGEFPVEYGHIQNDE